MNKKRLVVNYISIFTLLLIAICCVSKNERKKKDIASDETKKTSVILRDSISFLESFVCSDTLKIISDDKFLYQPFGYTNNINELINRFNGLKLKEEFSLRVTGDSAKLIRFFNTKSYIKFYFVEGAYDGEKKYQILSAKISDKNVILNHGIHVGMSKYEFISNIGLNDFKYLPSINVIELVWNLVGVWHYYSFSENTLTSIIIDSDYLLNKD